MTKSERDEEIQIARDSLADAEERARQAGLDVAECVATLKETEADLIRRQIDHAQAVHLVGKLERERHEAAKRLHDLTCPAAVARANTPAN